MKMAFLLSLLCALLAFPYTGRAEEQAPMPAEGPLLVRVRGLLMLPANGSDAVTGIPEDAIHVSNKFFPEVDVSYYFAGHFAAELILTYPQTHDVTVSDADAGTFSHLPPTLLLQYHILPEGIIRPYVGLGGNLTFIISDDLDGGLELSSPSLGVAGQVGADFKVVEHWFLNADVKFVTIRADVNSGEDKVTSLRVDPWLLSIGAGYRF